MEVKDLFKLAGLASQIRTAYNLSIPEACTIAVAYSGKKVIPEEHRLLNVMLRRDSRKPLDDLMQHNGDVKEIRAFVLLKKLRDISKDLPLDFECDMEHTINEIEKLLLPSR